jgi:hypothetical protein
MIKNVTISTLDQNQSYNATDSKGLQYPLDMSNINNIISLRIFGLYEHAGATLSNPDKAEAKNAKYNKNTLANIMLYQVPVSTAYTQNWGKQEGMFKGHGGESIAGLQSTQYLANKVGTGITSTVGALWGANDAVGTGKSINPFLGVAYESPELRSITLPFVMNPRSEQEARAVMNIIKTIKYHSSPSYYDTVQTLDDALANEKINGKEEVKGSLLSTIVSKAGSVANKFILNAPDVFEVNFLNLEEGRNHSLFKFGPAVLTDFQCNYGADGVWRAFKNGLSINVEMSLNFQEMDILTRAEILKGY